MIRRLRIVLSGAVVLLVLALAAGGVAAIQSDRAADNAARAEQAAVSADARRVGARAQLTDDISLSLLLAAAGARLDDTPETRVNLLAMLAKHPTLVRSATPGGDHLEFISVSRDGQWIASSDDQNRMHLYDGATNRQQDSYDAGRPPEDVPGFMVGAFSPDSSQLAVILTGVESTEPVRLLDPDTMEETTKLDLPGGKPVTGADVQFSADGRYLAATVHTVHYLEQNPAETTGYAVVWDLDSPSSPPARVPTGFEYQGLALSPDGQTLYTGWPLTAYDVASGNRIWRQREKITASGVFDVNARGTLLALGNRATPRDVLLVDAATGETVHTLVGHRDTVRDIRFSPDGSLVGSIASGELSVWDAGTGRLVDRWDTFDAWGVGFGPDNDLVYGGGGDSMLRTWDLSGEDTYLEQTTRVGDAEMFAHADVAPDGRRVAYRWVDETGRGWVTFVDTVTGERTPRTRLPAWEGEPWNPGTWHPQGGRYVGYGADGGTAAVLDPATGMLLGRPRAIVGRDGYVAAVAYVDEDRSLLASDNEEIIIVDAETLGPRAGPFDILGNAGSCCATPIGDGSSAMVFEWIDGDSMTWRVIDVTTGAVQPEGEVDMVTYTSVASPDGSTVAVAGDSGQIVTIDVSTGDQQQSTSLGAEVWWLAYSDDGEVLVSGAKDGGVSLWDAATLELLGTVYPPHRGEPVPSGVQFIGDTHDVAIASYDGTVYRWETDVDRALDFTCQMAGRDLTEEEWAEFLPAQPYQSVCPQE